MSLKLSKHCSDRVLVNAETTETDLLVNQRMAYVAVSRARFDARIYTDSAADLARALARREDKTMALEAIHQSHLGPREQGTTNEFGPPTQKRADAILVVPEQISFYSTTD
jgi:hypothetical protein